MSDIVERLRDRHRRVVPVGLRDEYDRSVYTEAADEIEALRSVLARYHDHWRPELRGDGWVWRSRYSFARKLADEDATEAEAAVLDSLDVEEETDRG